MNPHALRILLAEDTIAPNADDGMDRVAALVAPLLDGPIGEIIEPEQMVRRINSLFPWGVTTDVCAVLLFRLSKFDVVERRRIGATFHYFYKEPRNENRSSENSNYISKFCEIFREYCRQNPTVSSEINNKIEEILEWDDSIINLFSEVLPDISSFWESIETNEDAAGSSTDAWERALVAGFLIHSSQFENESAIVERIATILVVRDVIQNYNYIDGERAKTNVNVILDTSAALSLLGVSGEQARLNAVAAFNNAKRLGCRLAVLPPTLVEMSYVLRQMLSNVGWERRGASANAIRRMDVPEQVVKDVANNPEKHLKAASITVLPRNLNSFPNEKQYFPDDLAQKFNEHIRWTQHPQSIDHDFSIFVVSARMRGGNHRKNMFDNSTVLVTTNDMFVRSANEFCLSNFLLNEQQCPVVVSQHAFAAAVWLRAGFVEAKEIGVSQLLSSCEAVVALHPGILQRIRSTLRGKPETLREFEILLSDRRCLDLVASNTLNEASVVNETTTLQLLDKMKGELTGELQASHAAELRNLMKRYDDAVAVNRSEMDQTVEAQRMEAARLQAELDEERRRITELDLSRAEQIDRRLLSVNRVIAKIRSDAVNVIWGIFSLFVGCLSFLAGVVFGIVAIVLVTLLYLLLLFRIGPFGRLRGLAEGKVADILLSREFSREEIESWRLQLKTSPDLLAHRVGSEGEIARL